MKDAWRARTAACRIWEEIELPPDAEVLATMEAAETIAREQRINAISTEHALLALIRPGPPSEACRLLKQYGVTSLGQLRLALITSMGGPGDRYRPNKPCEITGNLQRAIELAEIEALAEEKQAVDVVHLLRGLIRLQRGLAARTLLAFGVAETSWSDPEPNIPESR
jgi:ATP-dependent Clp protease ATP-binding subunit ClpA